jgi:hypothetical protein
VVSIEDGDTGLISPISLHPVGAFLYGLAQIGCLEDNGIGLTYDTFDFSENKSGYLFQNALNSLLFDSLFWGILC